MTIYSQISANRWKTFFLMIAFSIFFGLVIYFLSQASGIGDYWIPIAIIFTFGSTGISYYFGDQLILTIAGAKEATKKTYFNFYTVTENLSIASGLPMPKVYVINDSAPNAFATGRDPKHAIVCATTGLLEKLNRTELEGVIAHELSHIKNFDTRLMMMVAILVGSIALIANLFMRNLWWRKRDNDRDNNLQGIFMIIGIVFAILSPIIAQLVQLAISRNREYLADASGALLTRYPEGLARALEKISQDPNILRSANPATAHLYISNPFKKEGAKNWFTNLFDTHPPVKERIRILRSM